MSMFYLVFEVRPDESGSVLGGAYVHCWIDRPSPDAAAAHAAGRLRDEGWIIDSCSEPVLARREDFLHDEVALEGFDMAAREGDSLQMHGWVFEGDV